MLFPTLGPSILPVVVAQRDAEQLLCWSGMTDTEHSTTSSSNEEEEEGERSCSCRKVVLKNSVYVQGLLI